MTNRFASCATHLWEIDLRSYADEAKSPVFNFLGCDWRLWFVKGRYHKAPAEVRLQRVVPFDKLHVPELNVTISLIDLCGDFCSERSICIAVDSLKEWILWSEDISEIKRHNRGFGSLLFLFSLQPKTKWRELFLGKYKEDRKISVMSGIQSLREDFGRMFDSQAQGDVILNCQDEDIYAHRLILSNRSKVFAAMFQNNLKESTSGCIEITDAEPSILKRFVRYLYVGEIPNLTPVTALKLYIIADKYDVDALKKCCAFFLMDNVENDDFFINYGAPDDENWRKALRPQLKNIKTILHTENWKSMTEEQTETSMELFSILIKDAYCKMCSQLSSS